MRKKTIARKSKKKLRKGKEIFSVKELKMMPGITRF
jgi:hypothetical protein